MCPRCANHFSPDGHFCPFDGEPLQPAPDWDVAQDPLIGLVVDGRYEVLSVLGEGGMGVVYEARHRVLGKRFALKALRKPLATDPEIAARFTQEAQTAASVSHPGLVKITDFGTLPTAQPFFVMELLEGQSLATLLRRGGPIPARRAVDLLRQVIDALSAAHEQSIIHRDLKPDNIYVSPIDDEHEHVTIVDFGLAKVIGASRVTRAGVVFGTPHYMSPEQAMGEATDHRADVYALGVVMYEMFTGRVPFEADSYMGVLTKHMYMAPTPPSQLVGAAKIGALEGILLRCLEKKPDQRYQSLRELAGDIDRVLSAAGEPVASSSPPSRRAKAVRSLLADELELPSREELSLGLDRGTAKRINSRLFSVLGALFLAGIGGMFAVRLSSSESLKSRARATPLGSGPASRATESPQIPAASDADVVANGDKLDAAFSAPAPLSPVAPAAPAIAAEGRAARGVVPAHSAPRSTHAALQKRPAAIGASEIVDPWQTTKTRNGSGK